MTTNTEREWIDAAKLREVIGRWDVLLADDDHEDMHGMLDDLRALLPTQQPRPEDAPDGYYLVRWWGEEHPVPAEKVQGQWWVIGKPTMLPAKDVLIVSRLIPEVKV